MNIYRLLFTFFMIYISVSCNEIVKHEVLSIEILYPKGPIETRLPLDCNDISRMNKAIRVDTILTDKNDLKLICDYLGKLRKRKSDNLTISCDIRTVCIIKYINRDPIQLCIGSFNCILKDNIFMGKNDKLVYSIRKCSGYYNYFPKGDLLFCDEVKKYGIPEDYKDLSLKTDSLGIPEPPLPPQ